MIATLVRVVAGFIAACLVAGLVQVCFVMTPVQLLSSPADVFVERLGQFGLLSLLAATHSAIFAAAFALIATGVGEWAGLRNLAYYLIAGTAIALLGFVAQFYSEAGNQPTIFNNYALKAYITAGFFSGLAYWLVAGRSAGTGEPIGEDAEEGRVAATANTWRGRPRIIVEPSPDDAAERVTAKSHAFKRDARQREAKRSPSLSEMLDKSDAEDRERLADVQAKSTAAAPAKDADKMPAGAKKP